MNNKKKELINAIVEKMAAAGVSEGERDDFYMDEPFTDSLRWIPEENLQKMLSCDLSGCTSFQDAYQAFGKCGALKFTPYLVQEALENPSLCLRRNRFLHMFRGYYFQVSGTIDGIMDCGTGSYRTDFLVKASYSHLVMHKGIISYMLWWAALIDAGFVFDNFRTLFDTDKSSIEGFLNKSMEFWRAQRDQSWSDIEPYIVFSNGSINKAERKMYELHADNKVYAYLAMGEKSVQVQLSGNRLLTITIPDINEGVGYDLGDEDDLYDFEEQVDILEQNHYIEMLAVMALALSGIKITFHNWYRLFGGLESMPHINAPGVVAVKSLNDIYKCEPDEF